MFDKVAIDTANNVFAVGRTYRFPTQEMSMTRYNSSGNVVWSTTLSDWPVSDVQPTSCAIDSAGDLYVLYRRGNFNGYRAFITKRSFANGNVLWFKELETSSGDWVSFEPAQVVIDTANNVHVTYTRSKTGGLAEARFVKYSTSGTVLANDFATTAQVPLGVISDTFVTPSGQTYFRFGSDPTFGPVSNTRIFRYPTTGWNSSQMLVAARIAYSPFGGGHLYAIGALAGNSYRLFKQRLSDGAITTRDSITAYNTLRFNELAADASGDVYLSMGGSFDGGATFDARRVKFDSALNGVWTLGAGFAQSQFMNVEVDRFGTALFGGIAPSTTAFVHSADALTGAFQNEIAMTSFQQVPSDLAVNSRGFAAFVGFRKTVAGGPNQGFVWLIGQSGLMNITVPGTEFLGGQTINAAVRRYAGTGSLTVNLSDDSTFATTPASASFGSGVTSTSAPITLLPTAVDRFVTLNATDGPMNRRVKFILKAPRPTSLVLSPSTVKGNASSTATVTMNGNAPSGGIRLSLASSNAFAVVPATALVPINQNRVNFTVTTTRPATTQTATISATYIGVTRSATLTILP